jgi:hypothetical protein
MSVPSTALASQLARLHDQDYLLWLEATCRVLTGGWPLSLEIPHLLAELEAMGQREKQAARQTLTRLLSYFLIYERLPKTEPPIGPWQYLLNDHRQRLQEAIELSPSLADHLEQALPTCYPAARSLAAAQAGIAIARLPDTCPVSLAQILAS